MKLMRLQQSEPRQKNQYFQRNSIFGFLAQHQQVDVSIPSLCDVSVLDAILPPLSRCVLAINQQIKPAVPAIWARGSF